MADGKFSWNLVSRILLDHLTKAAAHVPAAGTYLPPNERAAQEAGLQVSLRTHRYLPPSFCHQACLGEAG